MPILLLLLCLLWPLAARAQSTPSPAPDAARLRVIVTVRSSTFCTAMKSMTLPLAFITHQDSGAMSVMSDDVGRLLELAPGPDDAKRRNRWSKLTATISLRELIYNVNQNLVLADNVMNQSWKRYPRGTNDDVDAMRQRLQNIVDLQRSVVNKYTQVANSNDSCVPTYSRPCHSEVTAADLAVLKLGDAEALADLRNATDPEDLPEANAHGVARFGTVQDIERQLDLQQAAFSEEATVAGKTCGM